jgi:hypothetical protein
VKQSNADIVIKVYASKLWRDQFVREKMQRFLKFLIFEGEDK